MALESNYLQKNGRTLPPELVEVQQAPVEGSEDKSKSARHPRWTRQETLILIEGKKIAENRGRKGRKSSSVFGSDQLEPKWDSVSSHCKQHEVNRGPVQCRKRWSNLVGDFKKIKAWESHAQEAESYWMMRNDLRKENKLPGYFDKEVYDVLDGKAFTAAAYQLALVTISAEPKDCDEAEEGEEEEEADALFDSAQRGSEESGLFSDSEKLGHTDIDRNQGKEKVSPDDAAKGIPAPEPISERKYQPVNQVYNQGNKHEQQGSRFWKGFPSREGCKRRRTSQEGSNDTNLEDRLIKVLDKNANMLNAQVEAQNMNCQLDRNQQKDLNENLVSALEKITNALTKIADKL